MGDNAVGKTSLIRRYVLDVFQDKYISTIGTKITKKSLRLRHPKENIQINMSLLIWDIMGDMNSLPEIIHSYNKYAPQKKYFENAKGGIIVCDITRQNTFQSMSDWVNIFKGVVGEVPLLFLGNKSDLKPIAKVETKELEELAAKFHSKYLFTSAKGGQNVEIAFSKIAKSMVWAYVKTRTED